MRLTMAMPWLLPAAIAALLAGVDASDQASHLRQVIVLSRHGVRGPYGLGTETPSQALLDKYVLNPELKLPLSAVEWGTSERDDPLETVSPKLTKHGFNVIEHMGEYFRHHLYREFLDDGVCRQTFSYADANQRDNLTARAFLNGLHPSCKGLVPITEQTELLFEQGQDPTANCPVTSRAVYEGIVGSNDSRFVVHEVREEIEEIDALLQCCAPSVCENDSDAGESTCDLFGVPTKWNGAFYLPWKDTLSDADYFSEWLLLQSLNNMTLPGGLTFDKVLQLARIHSTHMDLITNEVNSASFGATLLAHITASFQQNVLGKPVPVAEGDGPRLVQAPDNRFLYYAAHDINILYVRNLLRLQWYTPGWHPHQPVPGSMLVFELHSTLSDDDAAAAQAERRLRADEPAGLAQHEDATFADEAHYFVKLFFVAASPQQIRNGDHLSPENPPDRVQVIIPSCSEEVEIGSGKTDVRCAFSTFKQLIGKTLKHECVADTLRPFVDSLGTEPGNASSTATASTATRDEGPPSTQVDREVPLLTFSWSLCGLLVASFIGIVAVQIIRRRFIVPTTPTQQQGYEYGSLTQRGP